MEKVRYIGFQTSIISGYFINKPFIIQPGVYFSISTDW